MKWKQFDPYADIGLLITRCGIGALFALVHGLPKLNGGPATWESIGRAVSYLGINFGHTFWGFAAAITQTLGGLLLILGYAHRPAAFALAITMGVATIWKYYPFGGWDAAAHPAAMMVICIGLLFSGPGKHSLDQAG